MVLWQPCFLSTFKVTMPMFRPTWPRACLLALALAAGASHAQSPAALQPAAQFFENPRFGGARFSPNGRLLAVRIGKAGRRDSLAVYDIASNKATQVASYKDIDVGRFEWVNDKRLVFDTADKQIGVGDMRDGPGLYAVNADGSELRQLALRRGMPYVSDGSLANRRILPANTFMLAQAGRQDSDSIYVSSPEIESEGAVNLLRLDTRNGRSEVVGRPHGARTWMLDTGGEPRLVVATEAAQVTLYERNADKQWRKAASYPQYAKGGMPIGPVGFGPDGVLYVKANPKKDTSALYTFDLATGKLSPEPLVSTPGYDFDGALVTSAGKLLGVRYTTDTIGTHWFDPRMREAQKTVDAALPATVNQISLPARPETPWVLVEAFSDVQPRLTLLYNMDTKAFNHIGSAHPDIKPAAMAQQTVVHYKARDGLDIPALLTLPAGRKAKGLPLVVLVHGGPNVRGTYWGWDADTQFLASRGYAVLEPEFRGSTATAASTIAPAGSSGAWRCRTISPMAPHGRSPRAWPIRPGFASPAPAMAAMRP
jgi:dipeptidyl aminopeptidase/acylaminoacyl peptidase